MNEIGRKIADKLIEIQRSKDFTIAFLPYKRSMWNSMESVYEECRASGIRTYCIPIPYYLMKGPKEAERIVSDKDLFEYGHDVSLLKNIKADFVAIHYPYDHNNVVTGMLSEYHTAELRKYGKVVYIPYSCTNMRQLRVQPGIANVDYAFLNTEEEADAFIKEWAEYGIDFSGRVFGLGSPKIDAIKKCKHREGTTLVINSLSPFLHDAFGRIELYKKVIREEIDKGRKVIFRPHPLLRQTIRSMRLDTQDKYIEMLNWIIKQGGGVDESEYLEKALSEADYLISDPSSVLEMWKSTGREYRVL
jgi:hypothetical protein